MWGIDNGLCFHVQPKVRTVIWDFGGTEIPADLRADLARLAARPPDTLDPLLERPEQTALRRRAAAVSRMETFPDPDPDVRAYPWPLV